MRKYTFLIETTDSQMMGQRGYFFIHMLGHNWKHAEIKARRYADKRQHNDPDYGYTLLSHEAMVQFIRNRKRHHITHHQRHKVGGIIGLTKEFFVG